MSDPFSDSHRKEANRQIREQSKQHADALTQAAKAKVTKAEADRKLSPNRDVGTPWQRKFYELREP